MNTTQRSFAALVVAFIGVFAAAGVSSSRVSHMNGPEGRVARNGGDTLEDPFVIDSLPFVDSGSTDGFVDDYDVVCPAASWAPDVVYEYTPELAGEIAIDLCGSEYDTKVYVFNNSLHLLACNDDYYYSHPCGEGVSKIQRVYLEAERNYIIVDGAGGYHGQYDIAISDWYPCGLDCPTGGTVESEPELTDCYVDSYNGGCASAPEFPFQDLVGDGSGELAFCGRAGWAHCGLDLLHDTDWFRLPVGPAGVVSVDVEAEQPTDFAEVGPHDCNSVGVLQIAQVEGCEPRSMTITGYAVGDTVWFVVAAGFRAGVSDGEFSYVLMISGLASAVAIEETSWSTMKALWR